MDLPESEQDVWRSSIGDFVLEIVCSVEREWANIQFFRNGQIVNKHSAGGEGAEIPSVQKWLESNEVYLF